jgi:hypothetical protein
VGRKLELELEPAMAAVATEERSSAGESGGGRAGHRECRVRGRLGQLGFSSSRAEGRGTRQPRWGALTRMEDTH